MSIFVARQPIVNRRGSVVAQELLFRDAQSQRANISDGFRCSAAVVERVLGAFGLEQVLDGTDGYLNTPAELIFSDVLELLPASRFTLEILEDEALTPELGAQCDRLRQAGFRIALDDVNAITPEIERFLKHVDIVKLDWPFIDPKTAHETVRRCRRAGKLVLAEKVEERADHARAMQAGVDLFQGYHFAKPQLLSSKREVASFAGVSKVLQLIMEDASHLHLEQALKNVPPLVVQVLRLANSGRSSRARQAAITSISQALSFVGSSQLARWCCLLMYGDSLDRSSGRDPIVTLVERRAGFMEQGAIVLRGKDREFSQSAWLTGLLSLVHVPNGADAASLIGQLPLDASIKDAIVDRRGDLGTLLSIVESMEAGDFNRALAQSCSFGPAFKARLPDLGW